MAKDLDFINFVVDQIETRCDASYRPMFGAFTLYAKGKVVGIVGDNQLFVKATEAGRSFIGDVVEAPPYPGANPAFLIEDGIEDGEWLTQLIALTEEALPKPNPKRKKKRQAK